MKVTYLGHSGFSVETAKAYYIFDPIRGTLPGFALEKPVYVFASHIHEDHFLPAFFTPEFTGRVTAFILSDDILPEKAGTTRFWNDINGKVIWAAARKTIPMDGFSIETLRSTDEGVAFIVREDNGTALYHAGDLNWWHWEGEDPEWNMDMARDYKNELSRTEGSVFTAAFVPLDPRLGDAYGWGLNEFLNHTKTRHVFPMHFWNDFTVIPRYIGEHPEITGQTTIHIISKEDESYEI